MITGEYFNKRMVEKMKTKTLKNLTVISGALIIIGAAWWCIQIILNISWYIFVGHKLGGGAWFLIPLAIGFIGSLIFGGKWSDRYNKYNK